MKCPSCGSTDVIVKKFGLGGFTVHERCCVRCDLFETRRSTDADFHAWWHRWSDDDDDDDPGAAAPKEPKAPKEPPQVPKARPRTPGQLELLRAICSDVGNDAVRLAFADAIACDDPARAEFIRCDIHRFADVAAQRLSGDLNRLTELRRRHEAEWVSDIVGWARPYLPVGAKVRPGQGPRFPGWDFERGFVGLLRTDPGVVADPLSALFATTPLEHLDLTADGPVLAALLTPHLGQLRSLGLHHLRLTDDDVIAFARDARLDRCEFLDLRSNNIGWRGVQALAASPQIRAIPVVLLGHNPVDPAVQYDDDHQGSIEMWLPPEGKLLEEEHGPIPWLRLPREGQLPDRRHARQVHLVEI